MNRTAIAISIPISLTTASAPALAKPVAFIANDISTTAGSSTWVQIGDLNRDGAPDVVISKSGEVIWFANDGAAPPGFGTAMPVTSINGTRFALGDLDRDGDDDVALANASTTYWIENVDDGTSFIDREIDATGGGQRCLIEDLNRDGWPDIIAVGGSLNQVSWYQNLGGSPPSFSSRNVIVDLSMTGPNAAAIADFDRDGDPDIVYCTQGEQLIEWLKNDGAASPMFSRESIPAVSINTNWHSVCTADMDCDGDSDFVVAAPSVVDHTIRWYENDGQSPVEFSEHIITNIDGPERIVCCDLDQDGDMDVLAALLIENELIWYDNEGGEPPIFTRRAVTASTGDGEIHVACADLDKDGDVDLVVPTTDDATVKWLRNVACPGDLDGDGAVGSADLAILIGTWGPCP